MEALVWEVIFTSTRHCTVEGVLVMEKLLTAALVVPELVKKAALPEPSSFLAVISYFTPLGGMAEVMVTLRLKGPRAGA